VPTPQSSHQQMDTADTVTLGTGGSANDQGPVPQCAARTSADARLAWPRPWNSRRWWGWEGNCPWACMGEGPHLRPGGTRERGEPARAGPSRTITLKGTHSHAMGPANCLHQDRCSMGRARAGATALHLIRGQGPVRQGQQWPLDGP